MQLHAPSVCKFDQQAREFTQVMTAESNSDAVQKRQEQSKMADPVCALRTGRKERTHSWMPPDFPFRTPRMLEPVCCLFPIPAQPFRFFDRNDSVNARTCLLPLSYACYAAMMRLFFHTEKPGCLCRALRSRFTHTAGRIV